MEEQTSNQSRQLKQISILVAIVGVIALGVISLIRERIIYPTRYQVSFTAEGRAFAKPDIAQVQLAVRTDRMSDSKTAVSENAKKMNAIIEIVKKLDIEEKDIKTSAYALNPEYDYPDNARGSVLAGYTVYQEVTVKVRDLEKVDAVIANSAEAGANQIGGVSFTIDDMTEIKQQARAEAVTKAKEEARRMADLTGLKLGKLVNVYENSGGSIPYYDSGLDKATGMGGAGGVVPDIQTGENEVVLQVTLTYEVK